MIFFFPLMKQASFGNSRILSARGVTIVQPVRQWDGAVEWKGSWYLEMKGPFHWSVRAVFAQVIECFQHLGDLWVHEKRGTTRSCSHSGNATGKNKYCLLENTRGVGENSEHFFLQVISGPSEKSFYVDFTCHNQSQVFVWMFFIMDMFAELYLICLLWFIKNKETYKCCPPSEKPNSLCHWYLNL